MVAERVRHYVGKDTNLDDLKSKVEQYLKNDGFEVQSTTPSPHGTLVQAKKGGWLRGLIDADRALSVLISGQPSDFTVRVGIGNWLKDIGILAVEGLLITDLFVLIDLPETLWNFEIEHKVLKEVDTLVG